METKFLDAVRILHRNGIFCDYLGQEINQLEDYAQVIKANTPYFIDLCNRIRELVYILDENSKSVYQNVNNMLEIEEG